MTQTSILRGLLNQAHDLHAAISAALETVQNNNGPIQPLEWHELAAAAQAANLTANLLDHMIRRGEDLAADEPVPYTLAIPGACLIFAHSGACEVRPDGTHTHPDNA